MVMVDINEEIYEDVKKAVKEFEVDYPTIKNFIDKAIREKVSKIRNK